MIWLSKLLEAWDILNMLNVTVSYKKWLDYIFLTQYVMLYKLYGLNQSRVNKHLSRCLSFRVKVFTETSFLIDS